MLCIMQEVVVYKVLAHLTAYDSLKNFGGDTCNRDRSIIGAISWATFFIDCSNEGLFPVIWNISHRQQLMKNNYYTCLLETIFNGKMNTLIA